MSSEGAPPSLRERRAQLTRDEILGAARRLFAERGYAGTSMRDIAQAAGVSAQTVYDSIGTKQELVARLNDLVDAEAGIAAIVQAARQSDDPGEVAATPARITRSILANCGDIVRAMASGAAAEPALAAALEEGLRRHVAGSREIVQMLRRLDAPLAADPDEVADALAALSDFRFALVLNESYGWPLDRIEDWIAGLSRAVALGAPRN
jgi:AcrR family transcriptional regulator